jgi:toxin-antitoxin system PIN domain toxin
MFAVDTNLLVYAHFDLYPRHKKARRFCRERLLGGGDEWCMGWQVCYEYLRIVTHPRVHQKPLTLNEALADLDPYLSSDECHLLMETAQHREILASVARDVPGVTGNLIHDCHYAALLKEHRVRTIYTADEDFKRFPFLKVVDPTA